MPYELLDGLHVLEVSSSLSVGYCGWLFADAGARVTRINLGTGVASPHPLFANYLNQHKDSRPSSELNGRRDWDELLQQFDVVIFDPSATTVSEWFGQQSNYYDRGIVGCAVSAYGLKPAMDSLEDDPLILCALTGFASVTPEDPANRDDERPMQLWGHQADLLTGLNALAACLQARIGAVRTGKGSFIDLAALNVLAAHATPALAPAFVDEPPPPPPSKRPQSVPRGMLRCSDGYIYTQGGDDNWDAWAGLIGRPEWTVAPFDDPIYRASEPVRSMIRTQVESWLMSGTAGEIFHACQAADIVTFPVNSIPQLLADQQVAARDSIPPTEMPGGGTLRVPRTPVRLSGDRMPSGDGSPFGFTSPVNVRATKPRLPLEGIRVADFSWVIAGPRCTSWLGAMGAEVIKVESHNRPDRIRSSSPFIGGVEAMSSGISFNMLNVSKKGLSLDLSKAEGRRLAQELVRNCDVAIENYSGPASEKLGLTYAQLSAINPGIIMISCSGLGRTGPDADLKAFGKSIHAYSGSTYLNSWPGTPPRGTGSTWTDPLVGVVATAAILEALIYRERTGKGAYFDLSMAESTTAMLSEAFFAVAEGSSVEPVGNADESRAVHDTFRCADGGWVAVSAPSGSGIANTVSALAVTPDVSLFDSIRARCSTWSRAEAVTNLTAAGLSAVPVRAYTELYADDPYKALMWSRRSVAGLGDYPILQLPWRQAPDAGFVYSDPPEIGGDTSEILRTVLAKSEAEIDALCSSGATL